MLKHILGFGVGFVNVNQTHLNANFDGAAQSFPYTPIEYTAFVPPASGQPIIMRTSTVPFLAGSLRRGAF